MNIQIHNMDIDDLKENARTAANLLKLLANEKRLLIMCTLFEGEKNVSQIEKAVGLSQSALSQHLALLRKDGLVDTRRQAQSIYYSACDESCKAILECLHGIYCKADIPENSDL